MLAIRAQAASIPLTSGLKISSGVVVTPGIYALEDRGSGIVQISGHDFTIDLKGAKLRGPGTGKGVGLHIAEARNVTIKNADVSGCLWGIQIERSMGVKLIDCVVSRNADLPPGTVIDESGTKPEDEHGGGILLRDSRNCLIRHCIAQHQWDGIDVVRSENNVIEEGDYSYNGNWGVHLWDASRNAFRRNRAVWCTTGSGTLFQALTGWQTYDAQAVGIDHNSYENLIEGNDLRFGGDAIFIRANEGPIMPGTVVPPRNGSHRNVLRNNDCSFSPNNAIEVDLVDDTVIEGNNCSNSNYGMWLGYSRRCIVRNNICINDNSKAVEIENGQGDVFENNVFGYDTPRSDSALIFLRQNGRDKTPSGPYTFKNNSFYGSGRPLLVRDTPGLSLQNTRIVYNGTLKGGVVTDEQGHKVGDYSPGQADVAPENTLHAFSLAQPRVHPGTDMVLTAPWLSANQTYVAEIEGIPAWVRRAENEKLTIFMPADFWDRPARASATLRLFGHGGWSEPLPVLVDWPKTNNPRVDGIAPNPAQITDNMTITGVNLNLPGTQVLFNNKPTAVLEAGGDKLTVKLPGGIITAARYNVLVRRGVGEDQVSSWPITVGVQVPNEKLPHLLSATFAPATLRVGEVLHVVFKVRNNLPIPVELTTLPEAPFTYLERQSSAELGYGEKPGTIHLRVTSDHPGNHEPGSWPYLFGFSQPMLAPGETITMVGGIRVETPGVHEFRVGLVASGFRFIDDNAFRTKITVLPR